MTAEELARKLNAEKSGDGWMARCPSHNDKTPSLSISQKDGGGFLYHCHAGCDQNVVYKALVEKRIFTTGVVSFDTFAKQTWEEAEELSKNSLGLRYLEKRGLTPTMPQKNIKFHSSVHYNDESTKKLLPALVCAIRDRNDSFLAIQRIYLKNNGSKANVEQAKKILGKPNGGSVHIGKLKNNDTELHVCEGVETALAINESIFFPVWAALTASNLKRMEIPDSIKTVHIWSDNDSNHAGQKAAEVLGEKLVSNGKHVVIHLPTLKSKSENESIDWLEIYIEYGGTHLKDSLQKNSRKPINEESKSECAKFHSSGPT